MLDEIKVKDLKEDRIILSKDSRLVDSFDAELKSLTVIIKSEVKSIQLEDLRRPINLIKEDSLEELTILNSKGDINLSIKGIKSLEIEGGSAHICYRGFCQDILLMNVEEISYSLRTDNLIVEQNKDTKEGFLNCLTNWQFNTLATNLQKCKLNWGIKKLTFLNYEKPTNNLFYLDFPNTVVKTFNSPNVYAVLNSTVPCDRCIGKALRKELKNLEDL